MITGNVKSSATASFLTDPTLGTAASADSSLALLDNLLDPEVRAELFPLIENLPEEERIRRLTRLEERIARERFLQTLKSRAKAFFTRS
jgi:hypothetical protein